MARVNLSQSPYYDDYSSSKQYVQLLAIPGRVAQAREFTTLQTTLREIIKSIGDSILKNGDVVEGCQVIVSGTNVTVTSGKVYVEGIVMPVEETTVKIKGVGNETVGVKLMEIIVDETSDSSLRDPAQGYDNYNQPGCNRLKRYLTVVVNDPEAATIANLIDGAVMVETYAPEYDTLSQTLARRTYDESGSYIVDGLKVRTEYLSEDRYNVVVEAGKAYILGYELKIPTARRISVDRSNTYSSVSASNYIYTTGTNNYLLDSDPYVRAITNVNGRVSTRESQSISTNVDSVLLDQVDVVRVVSVMQGETSYTVGVTEGDGDCYLQRNGTRYYLTWNGTENHPSLGSTYTVTYEYNANFIEGSDYELSLINGGHYLTWLPGGNNPLDETTFSINYEQYLARKDIVYIDRYGAINVVTGIPGEYGFEVFPEAPVNTLVLANIQNPPNGSVVATESSNAIEVSNIGLTRFTMNDIQSILNRVQTMEYDQAVMSLNDDARQTDTVNDKKGIFSDPLVDLSRIDFYFNLSEGAAIDISKPIFDMALDLATNICYLPIVTNTHDVTYDASNSNVNKYGRLVSLAVAGENVVLSQMNATKSFLVNPYSMFPQMPEVAIDPAVDNWIEDTIIEVPVSLTDSTIVSTSTRTIDNRSSYQRSNYTTRTSTNVQDTAIGTKTSTYTSESVINEQSVTYIRRRTINVVGKDFPASLDNIRCYFDGVLVPLTAGVGTESGTLSGSVRANASGSFNASFVIPENILTGVREVLLKSDTPIDGYITEGFTLYIAEGIARTIQRTVTTLTTVLLQRVTTTNVTAGYYVDPVGQTFVLDRMTLVKGIDVYFESKPDTNTSISCEIREVQNGTITPTIYAHKSLSASSVAVSADGSAATRFNFDDPVLIEENKEYAFVLRSTSDAYRVWVSELGESDIITGDIILKNSYMTGVMLSSSNNSTWTSHQSMDMKFRIVEDIYTNTSTITMNNITVDNAARLYLTADSVMPQGTSVDWTYSTDGITYKSITPYNIHLLNGVYNTVTLKAVLKKVTTANISPLLALDTIYLTASHYDAKGCYISKNITGLDPYTKVKIVVDTYKPSGTSLIMKVSADNGETLLTAAEVSNSTLSYGWKEQVFEVDVTESTQCRVFIEASSSTKYLTPSFRRLRVIMS